MNEKNLDKLKKFDLPNSKPNLEGIKIVYEILCAEDLEQLLMTIQTNVEALLSSKFRKSLKIIILKVGCSALENNRGEDWYIDKPTEEDNWKEFLTNITDIKVQEVPAESQSEKSFRIIFPEGQEQDSNS